MENEYQVLNHLQENENTTQRKISKGTGLSLGAVNLLLKKMVRKGLVKVEKLNARTVRYILTPKGMQQKSRLTYRYIRQSYSQIRKINQAVDYLLAERAAASEDGEGEGVYICGPFDEIMEILTQHLNYKDVPYELCENADSLAKLSDCNGHLVLIWREEEENLLAGHRDLANIMKMI